VTETLTTLLSLGADIDYCSRRKRWRLRDGSMALGDFAWPHWGIAIRGWLSPVGAGLRIDAVPTGEITQSCLTDRLCRNDATTMKTCPVNDPSRDRDTMHHCSLGPDTTAEWTTLSQQRAEANNNIGEEVLVIPGRNCAINS
jgi:hypothetical protein